MKKFYFALTALLLTLSVNLQGQIGVTVSNPTNTTPNLAANYSSLASALSDLNAVTAMAGPVVLTLNAGESETAPPDGFTLGSATLNPNLNSTNSITITKAVGAATTLNAGVGVSTPISATPDGIFKLVGTDFVTIDGLTLFDGNVANPATMEFGIALFKLSLSDGAQNNTVRNCSITLNRINNASGTAPMVEGAVGILIINSAPGAAITGLVPTGFAGSNSLNKIYTNNIQNVNYGVVLSGYAAPAPYNLGDTLNDIGGASLATGNTILNYGGGASATNPAAAIRAQQQWGLNISYNSINSNNGAGVNHPTTLRGIYGQSGAGAHVTITYNNVTVRSGATTSALTAIENVIGSTANNNTVDISNNIVQNCTYAGATTGTFTGILLGATATNQVANNNQVINNTIGTSPSAFTAVFQGIYASGSSTNFTANGNTVSGNVINNDRGSMYAIRASTSTLSYNGNTITNNSIPNNTGATSAVNYGFYDGSAPVNETYTNNVITNLTIAGSSTATGNSIAGIYNLTTSGIKIFSGNRIGNLSFTSSSTGYAFVAGIRNAYTTTTTANNNVIYNISSSGSTPTVAGIYLGNTTGGTYNIYNNLIGNITTPQSTGHNLFGIYCGSVGTSYNLQHNTIYLSGTSTGANFSSSAIFMSSTTPTVTIQNNILVNTSVPTGTGYTAALRRTSATLTGYGAGSNNNLFYAGTPSANSVIYYDGTNADQTLASFKARVSPREASSITENPSFLSTTGGAAGFLHIDPAVATQVESAGLPIAAITTDIDGDTRNVTTPDVGADEFTGIPLDLTGPAITITPLPNTCTTGSITINASISDGSGVPTAGAGLPVLYFRINAGAYVASTGTHLGAGVYQFSLGAGAVTNDVISYYVVAQDNAGNPSASPATGAAGFTINPPAVSTAPTTPYTYTVTAPLGGTFTVGATGNYPTITAALSAYNQAGCYSGPITFNLIDATYPTETFPLVINSAISRNAAQLLTIKAASPAITITGAVANGALLRIFDDYTVIDGSISSGTRDLTIANTSTTGPQVVLVGSTGTTPITNVAVGNSIVNNGVNTSSAIVVSDGTAAGSPGYFSNILLANNSVQRAYIGMYINAAVAPGNGAGVTVAGNTLNSTGVNAIRYVGIYLQGVDGGNVIGNTLGGFDGASAEDDKAVWLATGTTNTIVEKNTISGLNYTGTGGYGGHGMYISTGVANANITIANNMLSNISGDGWDYTGSSVLDNPIGLVVTGTQGNIKLYHNSINLYGNTLNQTNALSMGIYLGAGSSADIRDNVIVNNLGLLASTGYGSTAIFAATSSSQFTSINYNNYVAAATGNGGKYIGQIGTSGQTTLAAWQAASTQDANSLNVAPVFVSNTDLHLQPTGNDAWMNQGLYISAAGTDIDNQARSTGVAPLGPDMGADEILSAVPVAIQYFTGVKQGDRNRLDWKVNCYNSPTVTLILERSADGRTYQDMITLNETAARCLTPFTQNDLNPLPGINYYRLKTIDVDGKISYSNVVALLNKEKGFEIVSLAPNPVMDQATLSVSSAERSTMEIVITDVHGKQISKQKVNLIAGNNQVILNLKSIAAGTYQVSGFTPDGEKKTLRFVKQ